MTKVKRRKVVNKSESLIRFLGRLDVINNLKSVKTGQISKLEASKLIDEVEEMLVSLRLLAGRQPVAPTFQPGYTSGFDKGYTAGIRAARKPSSTTNNP